MTTHLLLTAEQHQNALRWLVFWHIVVIASSNYLVQIPFSVFDFHTTWGAFTFPFIFLTTDLTVRIFGALPARRIIFWAMFPALIISYFIGVLFSDGQFNGFAQLMIFNTFVGRIALASFLSYIVGQLLDITVFNRLRQLEQWWIAPLASTIVGNAIDSLVFFTTAFYRCSDEFMATHWVEIAALDYGWKMFISVTFFLPAYGWLLKKLTAMLLTVRTKTTSVTY
ncbi:7-cyano-7-deazaguanine/7-aminomethyl-7-deazaguanine transporter [Dichelobacter nodosus]|uniref:Probable queuosine precursor transporter n=1 Tax=Dichelobacter nodosus (strain VCS1703A) TaxID=246195 RepID=A5EYF6_DICNV|nr:7-cyano-7-deazaguanine/7-aminomethyl-7-deazaguanine transporter [Dichelobacter nodosus]ABQ14261.1 conserved hypothetical membrane protein [Dichelobacter nodosus VCS1703A]AXM45626.1 7-cyano-7-deazaguanine/7-aminomethyl-7-deazaguanine transporter [Dichelobacter nodosus]KNZ38895.1 hypothetical protein AKG33_06650 [Dichelobacter nodosus]TGA66311.1 7-cyano-7-deazaguanine/7-aminomethyl-7-deazaguanine transporter [Dichelobacter nodosus]